MIPKISIYNLCPKVEQQSYSNVKRVYFQMRKKMKKMHFKIDVRSTAEKAYKTMLGLDDKSTYENWTSEFNPTSTYEGSWNERAKILFTGTDENGIRGGMIARIAENKPYKFVSIQHYGLLERETEITEGPNVEKWAGAFEDYTFVEHNGVTTISVEVDVINEYEDYFSSKWPIALEKLKEIIEETKH